MELDFQGSTYVKTPYANMQWMKAVNGSPGTFEQLLQRLQTVKGFTPEQGVGQGDGPSPAVFNGFIDIVLTAMDKMKADDGILHNGAMVNTKAFADDLSSPKWSLAALQKEAYLMSAFA